MSPACLASSTSFPSRGTGRLSMQKNPASSSARMAEDLPLPLRPVTSRIRGGLATRGSRFFPSAFLLMSYILGMEVRSALHLHHEVGFPVLLRKALVEFPSDPIIEPLGARAHVREAEADRRGPGAEFLDALLQPVELLSDDPASVLRPRARKEDEESIAAPARHDVGDAQGGEE